MGETGRPSRVRRKGPCGRSDLEGRRIAGRQPGRRRCGSRDVSGPAAGRGRRGMGRVASLRARGGVPPRRSSRRRARLGPRRGGHAGGGTGSGQAGEGRNAPCREPARGKGHAHHEQGRGRRAGNDCPGGGRPGTGNGPDARPGRGQGPEKGTADARPAGRGQADPLGKGPRYRRAGLCRDRQDHHAEPRPRAPREARLRCEGSRALGLRRANPGGGGRDQERDPATLPCQQRRGGRGTADEEGREGDAGGLSEDRAGGGRGIARLHGPGPRPPEGRKHLAPSTGRAGGRCEAARRGGCRQAVRAVAAGGHEDGDHGGDHAPA